MSRTTAQAVAGGESGAPSRLRVSDEFDRVMQGIQERSALIRADGEEGEERGAPTPEVIEALDEIGVFRAALPREVGGYEFSPRQLVLMMEALASHDTGTAWTVLGVVDSSALSAAFLEDVAIEEYFGEGRVARMSGQGTREGAGKRVPGGYLVSGSWQFNSGSCISTHIHTAIRGDDNRSLVATLPIDQVTQIDNWDVLGLRATASHDYRIDGVFVADTHMYDPIAPVQRRGGAVFQAGLANLATLQHAAWALGASKRLLEEIREISQSKASRPRVSTSTDAFYGAYADLEARYRGSRAFLLDTWGDVEATLDEGEELSTEQISLINLGTIATNRAAQAIANEVMTWAGTTAMRRGSLQRYFRDVYTGVQHLVCSPPVQHSVGKQLAGRAAPGTKWGFYDLVEPSAPLT